MGLAIFSDGHFRRARGCWWELASHGTKIACLVVFVGFHSGAVAKSKEKNAEDKVHHVVGCGVGVVDFVNVQRL